MKGYVALHRQIMDSWVSEDPMALALWVRMLLEATHKPRKKVYKGEAYHLNKGQFLFGLNRWSEKTGIPREVIRKRIDMLVNDNVITRQKHPHISVITVVKWDSYQQDNTAKTPQEHPDNTAGTQQEQQYNNGNNGDNGNNVDKKEITPSASQAKTGQREEVIKTIFDYWHSTMKKDSRTKLSQKRKSAINARLNDGFTPREICEAIKGCSMTPHNMGDNDRNKPFNDIELICRDDNKLTGFIETSRAGTKKWSAGTQKTIDTLNNMELD